MKKIYWVFVIIALMLANFSSALAEETLYEGEGYVVPSEKSQEPFDPGILKRNAAPVVISASPVSVNVVSDKFPDIVLYVTVTDENGNQVTGLKEDDFIITEKSTLESAPVEESKTCFQENPNVGQGISFSLVFDLSGSMELYKRLEDAKKAASDFMKATKDDDRASLVTFSSCDQGGIVSAVDEVKIDKNNNGIQDIVETINSLNSGGRTALFDGIANGIDSISQEAFPKGVIVFTDGISNDDCHYSISEVIKKALDQKISIYTIGLTMDNFSPTASAALKKIAEETGGIYSEAPTAQDMTEIYLSIAEDIRSRYMICYTSHNPAPDGTTRDVNVVSEDKSGTGPYTVDLLPGKTPPVIVHTPVAESLENQLITINADISDPDEGDSITQAVLSYLIPGTGDDTPYTTVDMINTGGNSYTAEIPANHVTIAGIDYFISACDANETCAASGSASNPYNINVTDGNRPPKADAGPDQSVNEGSVVTLDASKTSDPDPDDTLTYQWRQIPESTVTLTGADGKKPSFTAPLTGPEGTSLTFELTVTDEKGESSADTVNITVNDFLSPEAAFTWSPNIQTASKPVTFTDKSVPLSGPIVSWAWNFDGKGSSANQNPVFTFPESGKYQVSLTVTDEDGAKNTVLRTVTVNPCADGDCGGGSGGCFIQTSSDKGFAGMLLNWLK